MNNLKTLDETLDFLNNKDAESTNESVLGTIAGVLVAPYLFVALCALIFGLISSIKNVKYKNMIFKNPEVTSSIKVFGKRLQEQIKKSMSSILEPLKVDYVEIVDKNLKQIENIELGNSIILVAAYVGNTRLIDNLWV